MSMRILVCLDGSSRAEGALPYAMACARAAGPRAELILAEVPEATYFHPRYVSEVFGELPQILHERVAGYLQNLVTALAGRGYRARPASPHGPVCDALLAEAEREKVSLIVLTSHGRTGLGRWMMGSVAERIVRHSTVPVLLVPDVAHSGCPWQDVDPLPPLRSALIPLDGSALSEKVFRFPSLVPIRPELVHLVYACNTRFALLEPGEQAELVSEAEAYLARVAGSPELAGFEVTVTVDEGAPAEAILLASEDVESDFIAMTTSGRSGLSHFLLGSVAEKVARASARPVLLINPTVTNLEELGARAVEKARR